MCSESLLQWLSLYPEKILSESAVNRACVNIEKSKGNYVKSTAQTRRKFLNQLLDYGHVEYANSKGTAYSVIVPTILVVNSSHTVLCGARTAMLVNDWKDKFKTVNEESGLVTCWSTMLSIKGFPNIKKSFISVDDILKKLPAIAPNKFGVLTEMPNVAKLKRFNPVYANWEQPIEIIAGVYRERDDLPPSVLPWYWIENTTDGTLRYWKMATMEATCVALCYSSVLEKQVRLIYCKEAQILKIELPNGVFLPLMVKRPLTWLNVNGDNMISRSLLFHNISQTTANEVSRIFNVSLQGEQGEPTILYK